MRIKELVEKSGVSRTTIHFYLREGLLHPPRKTGRTMAYYDDSHLQRLRDIEKLKQGSRMPVAFLKAQVNSGGLNTESKQARDMSKAVTTTREKQQKRQEIIRQGIKVFSQKGYHRTNIVDITRPLKISTGTFYLYFKNKKALFIEVINDIFYGIVGEAAIAIKGEDNFVERMKIRGRVFYENYSQYNEILNQLRAEMAGEDQWPAEKIKKIYYGLTRPIIREIEAAVGQGIMRKIDPDLLAFCLTGLIEIMSLRLSLDKKYSPEDAIQFIVGLSIDPLLIDAKKEEPGR